MTKSRVLSLHVTPKVTQKQLLILLSNQYSNDSDIDDAISNYSNSIKPEGWSTVVHKLSPSVTDFREVDEIIEDIDPYATMIIGEDTPTALRAELSGQEMPSTVPFYTTGGEDAYTINKGRITGNIYKCSIPTSLIFLNHDNSYDKKKNEIISTLNKFSTNRNNIAETYGNKVVSYVSVEGEGIGRSGADYIYSSIEPLGDLTQYEDAGQSIVDKVLIGEYKMVSAFGHACPSRIVVKWIGNYKVLFLANVHARKAKTPMLMLHGCYVSGWKCKPCHTSILDPPTSIWFGHQVIDSQHLRIVVAGFPIQGTHPDADNFVNNCIPDLANGKSLAESMKNKMIYGDDSTIYGDITFHY